MIDLNQLVADNMFNILLGVLSAAATLIIIQFRVLAIQKELERVKIKTEAGDSKHSEVIERIAKIETKVDLVLDRLLPNNR
jgi:hypothetical protein